MSYAEALERLKKFQDGPGRSVPKVTNVPSGTFGTQPPGPFQNFKSSGSCQSKALSELRSTKNEVSNTTTPGSAISAERVPDFQELAPICREACERFPWIYWADFARWLIDQGDPGWYTPDAVRWWARYVAKRGYPDQ